jgi:hypothetical protein
MKKMRTKLVVAAYACVLVLCCIANFFIPTPAAVVLGICALSLGFVLMYLCPRLVGKD